MRLIYILILFLISFVSCTDAPHIRAADQVMNSFTEKMEAEGFSLVSSGGAMMGDIQKITLSFAICENFDITKARLLFIQKSEELIYQVNSNQNIQPYLHDHPFTSKNIFFKIAFYDQYGDFVNEPYVAYVTLIPENNRIYYSIYDKQKDRLQTIYDESYEEALVIYHASNCSTSLK